MIVNTDSSFLKKEAIETIEKEYKAKYVLETCLLVSDKFSGVRFWADFPAAIFYTEKAHPQGSNYFALYFRGDTLMITNGLPSIKDVVFKGIEAEGEVIYSRYRHAFREGKNGGFVDGGRDYFKYGGDSFHDYNIVKFIVIEDRLEFIDQ